MNTIDPPTQLATDPLALPKADFPAWLAPSGSAHSLLDLMYDGFYALFLLKNRCAPQSDTVFLDNMKRFLDDFERQARKLDASPEDIHFAKYAYCAAVDEIILQSQFNIRASWERRPLQLELFGDQLAGENFFRFLEELRAQGTVRLQVLEVFHMCLLLGFQGKYMLEGQEKINYLTASLGAEIARMKGKHHGFAPHAERPDHIVNRIRTELPLWVICSMFALLALGAYLGLDSLLADAVAENILGYSHVVKLAPRAPHLLISLP